MSTTILGKLLKKLRVEHSETINDMAKKLEITPSYLSSIGVGKRPLPAKQLELIKKHYHPTRKLLRQLFWAAEFSKQGVKINYTKLNDAQRQLAAVFARNASKLDIQAIAQCYQSLGIPIQELRGWCALLKQNQGFYKPLQHILEYIQNERHRHKQQQLILKQARLDSSQAAKIRMDGLLEQVKILQEALPDNENIQALASNLKNSLQHLSLEIVSLSALLNSEDNAEQSTNQSSAASTEPNTKAADETDELYDTGPGQELLDL